MKIEGKRILITGGAGFIGSHLVDALSEKNYIVVLDNFSSGKRENLSQHLNNPKVEIVEGDVRDNALLKKITKDIDIVYHLAVQCLRVSIRDPLIVHEVNATGTLNLCMASRENGVKLFVYISSSEVYGTAKRLPMSEDHPLEPTTVYGASKLAGELYTLSYYRTYGLQGMVIRPFNTYGARAHFEGIYGEVIPKFITRALNDMPPVIFGDGTQTRDFTYISDIVKGIITASQCDAMIGEVVNLARGEEVSIKDLASIICDLTGRRHLKPLYERKRPGDVLRHCADITKAKEIFNFNPEVNIREGIKNYLDWLLKQNYDLAECLKQDVVFNW